MPDRRLHLLVEGHTENAVVRNIVGPHLESAGWIVSWSIVKTGQPRGGPVARGGVTSWTKLANEIKFMLHGRGFALLTTMIDYYAFPLDAPGMSTRPAGDARAAVEHVEHAIADAVGDRRFVPHLTLHELEAWVFAAADQLGELYGDHEIAKRMRADVADAGGSELINGGRATAPSKRLLRYWPDYAKIDDGPLAIAELGLPALRERCPHLDAWLVRLEQLAGHGARA